MKQIKFPLIALILTTTTFSSYASLVVGYPDVPHSNPIYPDGKEYVHNGIQPDTQVNYSQNDIYQGIDPILTKGIEVIKNWESYRKTTTFDN